MEVDMINVKSLEFDGEPEVAPGEPAGGGPAGGLDVEDILSV